MTNLAEIYENAADELTVRGRTTGKIFDVATGRVCAIGALCLANGEFVDYLLYRRNYLDIPGLAEFDEFLVDAGISIAYDMVGVSTYRTNDKSPNLDMADLFRQAAKEIRNNK